MAKKSKNISSFLHACPVIRLGRIFGVFLLFAFCFLIFSYLTLRFAQPYLFANPSLFDTALNSKVLANWKQLKSFDDPNGWFPPGIQWIKTKPYLFPLKNMILWGLGIPLGTVSMLAVGYQVLSIMYYIFKRKIYLLLTTYYLLLILSSLWILLLFFYQGAQFVKALRYFIPIYPFLAIISAWFVYRIAWFLTSKFSPKIGLLVCWFVGLLIIIYPISFISIYSRPHTRVQASRWIYQNIPPGITRSGEHWDDFLPLSLPTPGYIHEKYKSVEFPLYGADTKKKWEEMADKLKKTDYIILSSNRLYGSIMTVPERYPITYQYYQALFDGSLGFEKVAEFTSRPNIPLPNFQFSIFNFQFSTPHLCLTPPFSHYGAVAKKTQECPLPGITFVDDYADETFTVYDHPKVIIFKKVRSVDYYNLLY